MERKRSAEPRCPRWVARDGLDNRVAVALKAAFFEAVFDDPDRARAGKELPLVGYVADEFHRFITSDPLHGEQSFLDTCRSFGAFCVLAFQSVASLDHALAHGGGGYRPDESAVEILWNNTANKIIFRSTDQETSNRVDDLCPYRPGLPRSGAGASGLDARDRGMLCRTCRRQVRAPPARSLRSGPPG